MKIDFHCHTKAVKKGEKQTRNISAKDFKGTIKDSGVRMVAITNHNCFDKKQFDEFKKEICDDFILLPGIELDVNGLKEDKGHIVLIYDDEDVDNFNSKISNLLGDETPDTFSVSIDKAIEFINEINCVVLAHYFKPDALNIDSINYMKEKINENFRFFYEPSSYRTLGIMINHNFRALKGTDIVDWSNYIEKDFANIKMDIDSYKQLLRFLKKDATVIESLLNNQTKYSVDIAYRKNDEEIVELYDDVNVFFGTKGTGKSISLDRINQYFREKGKKISLYSANDNKDKLDKKLSILDEEKKLINYGKENYSEKFKSINEWIDADVTQFLDYINYVKYKNQNANKQRMKIIEMRSILLNNSKTLQDVRMDFDNIKSIISLLENIKISSYIDEKDGIQLMKLISKLLCGIKDAYSAQFDDKLSTKLSNDTIKKIKSIIEKNTETKTIPNETGFSTFAKKRFLLEIDIKAILDGFDFRYEKEPEFIGILEEGKILSRKTVITMLNESSKTDDGFTGIKNLKELKEILNLIKDNIYSKKLLKLLVIIKKDIIKIYR